MTLIETGVSHELAKKRKVTIKQLEYTHNVNCDDEFIIKHIIEMVSREGSHIKSSQTEPRSTYLFSIEAGE